MDVTGARALVLDARRTGSATQRREYRDELRARYAEIEAVMVVLAGASSWERLSRGAVDQRLELTAEVVYQLGELIGDYEEVRCWGDRILRLGGSGSDVRRADLMLRLSELHRVTGRTDTWADLVRRGAGLLGAEQLSPDEVDALAPVSCNALFCLGSLAAQEDRGDDARALLSHAWTHGGDSDEHLWSLLMFAAVESGDGHHESALPMVEAAVEMAQRLGETRSIQAARNNLACTLRWMGRHAEAYAVFEGLLPEILEEDQPDSLFTGAEDFACLLFDMGRERDGALLLGAAEAERASLGVPRVAMQEVEVTATAARARDRLGAEWAPLTQRGADLGVLAALAAALRTAEA
jgi:hypothetical protein